jgi:hypothetical protein
VLASSFAANSFFGEKNLLEFADGEKFGNALRKFFGLWWAARLGEKWYMQDQLRRASYALMAMWPG